MASGALALKHDVSLVLSHFRDTWIADAWPLGLRSADVDEASLVLTTEAGDVVRGQLSARLLLAGAFLGAIARKRGHEVSAIYSPTAMRTHASFSGALLRIGREMDARGEAVEASLLLLDGLRWAGRDVAREVTTTVSPEVAALLRPISEKRQPRYSFRRAYEQCRGQLESPTQLARLRAYVFAAGATSHFLHTRSVGTVFESAWELADRGLADPHPFARERAIEMLQRMARAAAEEGRYDLLTRLLPTLRSHHASERENRALSFEARLFCGDVDGAANEWRRSQELSFVRSYFGENDGGSPSRAERLTRVAKAWLAASPPVADDIVRLALDEALTLVEPGLDGSTSSTLYLRGVLAERAEGRAAALGWYLRAREVHRRLRSVTLPSELEAAIDRGERDTVDVTQVEAANLVAFLLRQRAIRVSREAELVEMLRTTPPRSTEALLRSLEQCTAVTEVLVDEETLGDLLRVFHQ